MKHRQTQLFEKQKAMYQSLTEDQLKIINEYFVDDMKKLRKICDPLIFHKGTPEIYHEDLYGVAADVLIESLASFDPDKKCSFKTFFVGNIKRAFYDWTRDSTRLCRCNIQIDAEGKIVRDANGNVVVIPSIPLDAPAEDGIDIKEKIASDFNIEDNLSEEIGFSFGENIQRYLNSLSETQRFIAHKIMMGYQHPEIREMLNFSEKKYKRVLSGMNTLEQKIMINQKNIVQNEGDKTMGSVQTQTAEKSKPMQYSIASIIKKMESRTIRFDHPLQRESDQWSPAMKGNLISDILQGNPLPEIVFAEQIINGIPIVWDLDGKQRCTNCYSFVKDGFKVSKNIRRWNIKYIAQVRREDGELELDKNGFPMSEYKEFDIRNKKFSQMPIELQEKMLDYTFKCDQYLNCSSEDIAYHIIRYNEGKHMNKAQKGITRIGEEFATIVKSISAMPFFREKGAYKMSDAKNGTLERVVIESIMACDFLEDWKKDQESICEYLKDNATEENFDNFEDMVNRLDAVITDDTADMFNSKDSFVWFGLFAKFVNTGEDDKKFVEFMAEITRSLHSKVVDGVSYDDLCVDKETGKAKATKDKYIVAPKMKLLEKLMLEFLHINKVDNCEITEAISTFDFVKENVNMDIDSEDVDLYKLSLDDYTVEIDESSKQMVDNNIQSFVALVAYAFENEIDGKIPNWLVDYTHRVTTYSQSQKENYLHMKKDFENYLTKKGVAA